MTYNIDSIRQLVVDGDYWSIPTDAAFDSFLDSIANTKGDLNARRKLLYLMALKVGEEDFIDTVRCVGDVIAQHLRYYYRVYFGKDNYFSVLNGDLLNLLISDTSGIMARDIADLLYRFKDYYFSVASVFNFDDSEIASYVLHDGIDEMLELYANGQTFGIFKPFDPCYKNKFNDINFSIVHQYLSLRPVIEDNLCVKSYNQRYFVRSGVQEHMIECCETIDNFGNDCNDSSNHFCCKRLGAIVSTDDVVSVSRQPIGSAEIKIDFTELKRKLGHSCLQPCQFLSEFENNVKCTSYIGHHGLCHGSSSTFDIDCDTFCCKCNFDFLSQRISNIYNSSNVIGSKSVIVEGLTGGKSLIENTVVVKQKRKKKEKTKSTVINSSGAISSSGFNRRNDNDNVGFRKEMIWCFNWDHPELKSLFDNFVAKYSASSLRCLSSGLTILSALLDYGMTFKDVDSHINCNVCNDYVNNEKLYGLWFVLVPEKSYVDKLNFYFNETNAAHCDIKSIIDSQKSLSQKMIDCIALSASLADNSQLAVVYTDQVLPIMSNFNTIVALYNVMDIYSNNVSFVLRSLSIAIDREFYVNVIDRDHIDINAFRLRFKRMRQKFTFES